MKIYTSHDIDIILENYNKGIIDIRTKDILYQNMINVKNPKLIMRLSNEELIEYAKCAHDPIYFFEKYCKILTHNGFNTIKLQSYQLNIINSYYDNRFNISLMSRQSGMNMIIDLLALYDAVFNIDKSVVIIGPKMSSVEDNMYKIKSMYENLPFFLKPGVNSYNKSSIMFDNGSRIIGKSKSVIGFNVHSMFIYDFAFMTKKSTNDIINCNIPVISSMRDSKLFISSSPNGINDFYKLYTNANRKQDDPLKNKFIPHSVYWWEIPGRNKEWKDKEISIIGEKSFNQQYDIQFLNTK